MLWVSDIKPKSFNLHNTHQKSNRQTLFLYSEKKKMAKNNGSEISQRSEIVIQPPTMLFCFFLFLLTSVVQNVCVRTMASCLRAKKHY